MLLAWHTAAFSRIDPLKSVEEYLKPDRNTVMFDDDEALEAALDRVVAQHSAVTGNADPPQGEN